MRLYECNNLFLKKSPMKVQEGKTPAHTKPKPGMSEVKTGPSPINTDQVNDELLYRTGATSVGMLKQMPIVTKDGKQCLGRVCQLNTRFGVENKLLENHFNSNVTVSLMIHDQTCQISGLDPESHSSPRNGRTHTYTGYYIIIMGPLGDWNLIGERNTREK